MSDGLSSDGPSSRRAGASYDAGKDDDELMAAGATEGLNDPEAIAKAMRRHELLKLKNRRAQARYRERTKAKALVWQDQVEVLTAALQQANAEKAVLAADKARLEQEVSRLRLQLSMGKTLDRPESKLGAGHGMATVLHEVHALAHAQPANMEADPDTTRAVQRVFALVRNGDAAPDAKEPPLSLDDIVRFYNVWVRELAAALMDMGNKPNSSAQASVEELVLAGREVSKKLHTRLPELSKMLDATLAKAPKEQFGPPSAQLWKRIVERVNLSPNQVDQIVQLHQDLLEQIYVIVEERRACFANLQATAAGADEAGNAASALLAASQASAQLKTSLLQEQQIVSTFLHHFCEKILEPVQEARMVVDAHPYIVNAYALCTAVAEAAGADAAPAAPLAALLAEDHPPSWSPLPPDSTFRALHAGEIRLHQGAAMLLQYTEPSNHADPGPAA
ncbi:g11569 [Coccomyxa elongata]